MYRLSRKKLQTLLARQGLNLSQACRVSGVSRQSIYNMLAGASVYNQPLTKFLTALHLKPEEVVERPAPAADILRRAPRRVQKVMVRLLAFCRINQASLLLFGSQVIRRSSARSDWDFGVWFAGRVGSRHPFAACKQKLTEEAFPDRVDIVVLNQAPAWFWDSIREEVILLHGTLPPPLQAVKAGAKTPDVGRETDDQETA